jgi:ribonuclease VapC
MFLDASALVAILTDETEGPSLADNLAAATRRVTSPLAIFETVTAVARKRGYSVDEARAIVSQFLELASVELMPIGQAESELAIKAFDHYGKGRHPAALNMGDCFAYGCAKSLGDTLLYVGDDFSRTDLA